MENIKMIAPKGVIVEGVVLQKNADRAIVLVQDIVAKALFFNGYWRIVSVLLDMVEELEIDVFYNVSEPW